MCRGRARGYIQLDNGLYCDVIFLGGADCQIVTSHPFFFSRQQYANLGTSRLATSSLVSGLRPSLSSS